MIFGTYLKQPSEVLDYDLDYSAWLVPGDAVHSATATCAPADDTLEIDALLVNDPRVKLWLSGGTSGTLYKLTVVMTTTGGRVREDEFKVRVKNQ